MAKFWENTKKWLESVSKKALSGLTKNQAIIIVLILTVVVMILFGATDNGRLLINLIGYITTYGAILYGAIRLYQYVDANAKNKPKVGEQKTENNAGSILNDREIYTVDADAQSRQEAPAAPKEETAKPADAPKRRRQKVSG